MLHKLATKSNWFKDFFVYIYISQISLTFYEKFKYNSVLKMQQNQPGVEPGIKINVSAAERRPEASG